MKIERLSIDGFGHFSGQELGPLDGGLVVFHGPNEAGKTTLLAFIQSILFGFPRKTDPLWVPALEGGRHGGRIVLTDGSGERYVIERHQGTHGGPVTVSLPDGTQAGAGQLNELLGHASRDVFESVFAFGLDQLQSLASLQGPDVSSHIYGAGAGTESLPRALKELEKRAGEIFLPSGRIQPVPLLLNEIEEVTIQLDQKRADASTYAALRRTLVDLEEEGARLQAQIQELNARRAHLHRLRNAWDDWVTLRQEEERLGELPQFDGFPEDGITRLQSLESQIQLAEREIRRIAGRLDEARQRVEAERPAAEHYQEALLRRQMLQHARDSWTRAEVSKRTAESELQALADLEQQQDSPAIALLLLGAGIAFAVTGIVLGGSGLLIGIGAGAMLVVVGLFLLSTGRQLSGRPRREEQRRRAEAADTHYQQEREQLERWLQQLGVSVYDDVLAALDSVERDIEAARDADERYRGRLEQVEREERQLAEREAERDTARLQLEQLLDLGEAVDAEEFRHQAARRAEREAAEQRLRDTLERLQRVSGPDEGWRRFRQELESVDPAKLGDELLELGTRLTAIEGERTAVDQARGSTRGELQRLEGDTSAADLRAKRLRLIEELRAHADDWSGYVLAQELLQRARRRYEQERQPAVIQTAQRHFRTITGGRYTQIVVPLDAKEIEVVQPNGARKRPQDLSRGAREQLYLALRFGFIAEFSRKTARLPVIVDDILVNFDPERARATAEAFVELSDTNQVIVFTCHPATVEHFRAASLNVQVVELEPTTVPSTR